MKRNFDHSFSLCIVVISLFSTIIIPQVAQSATFNVTTVNEFDAALSTSQQNGENDTINVAAGTYDVSAAGLTYVAKDTAPEENFTLTIEGAGPGQTIIDGGDAEQCLLIMTTDVVFDDSAAAVTVRGITFQRGTASNGGGAYIRTLNATITVENSSFNGNDATFDGGGLYTRAGTGSIMISEISASTNTSGGGGAGAYAMAGGDLTVLDSVFDKNTVIGDNTGGGLHAYSNKNGMVTVSGSTFTGNEALAADAIAGGSYQETNSPGVIVFVNNTLSGNSSLYGGGAYFTGGDMTIANNTLSGNHAMFDGGGMILELQGGTATVSNNIVWGNTAVGSGADIRLWDGPSDIAVIFENDYADLSMLGGGSVTEDASNINSDPLFLLTTDPDPSNWDLHLTESSPCVDAGDNNLVPNGTTTDRDGDSRQVDGDVNGSSLVDMGSDEFIPNPHIQVSGTSLDFGSTAAGTQSITITNTGTVLAIGTIAFADPLAPPFSITADTCSNTILPNMGTCGITVDFDATTVTAAPTAVVLFTGIGALFIGTVMAGYDRKRRLLVVLMILAVVGVSLYSCSGDDGEGTPVGISDSGDSDSGDDVGSDDEESAPVNYSDSFDIPSNDPANPSIIVTMSGSN